MPSVNSLTGVWFADPTHGWATGQAITTFDGVVAATTDGWSATVRATSWNARSHSPQP